MKSLSISLIRLYRIFYGSIFRYFIFSECRFYPSCSEYSIKAIKNKGVLLGGYMSIKRIFRCNPLFRAGYDPVK